MIFITNEEAINKIYSINDQFIILSDFKGWRDKITRKCKTCGDTRDVQARALIELDKNGNLRKCPVCAARERAQKKRKTHDQFLKELYEINPDIEILSEYITNSEKVKCKCLIDNHEWSATPHSLLEGHGCPECARKKQNRRNEKEYIAEMQEKQPNIEPIWIFSQSKDLMKFRCKKCDYKWITQAYIPLTREGYQCPKCTGHAHVTETEMKERLHERNPLIQYVSGYKDMLTHATFHCTKCNRTWNTSPVNLLNDKGCPYCRMSHGEKNIMLYLEKENIDYEFQYVFDDCIYQRVLPFDFYIPDKNLCIEFDGIQHFEPTRFNKKMTHEEAIENYNQQVIKDNIKTNYCKNNEINLLRIPYTEFKNIESILNKYLS